MFYLVKMWQQKQDAAVFDNKNNI